MSLDTPAGKVALITGAFKGFPRHNLGIDKVTAARLERDGASIVINYVSDFTSASELVKQIGSNRVFTVQTDAGSVSDIEIIFNTTVKHFGKIDILVLNADILPMKTLKEHLRGRL